MKILESRPQRYDWGIDFLTKGQAGTIKEHIVTNFVRSGMAILDVGCGTGDLAVGAARAGAFVTGVDISEGMLAVAQDRVKKNGLENKVVLHHAGAELVNENETLPATIYCSAGSLFGDAGLLIQTASGSAAGFGGFPLNRFGCFS